MLGEPTSIRTSGFSTAWRSSESRSTGPHTTLASGYVMTFRARTRTLTSEVKTLQGRPPSCPQSRPMTLAQTRPCSGVPPAIAKISPSRNSWRTLLDSSMAR